jgi:integrase
MEKIEDVTEEKWTKVNPETRKMIDEFLEQSTTLSDYTLTQYKSGLRIFAYWVFENLENIPFHEIKSRDFLKYQNWLIKLGQSSNAIKFKRSCVSSFNNWVSLLYEDKYPNFRNYITKAIALPASEFRHEKNPPTLEEYNNLCKVLEERGDWLYLAYVRVSFETGGRRNEVRQLLKEVVNYEPKIINIDGAEKRIWTSHKVRGKGRGKNGKPRTLQFGEDSYFALKKWLDQRGEDDCPYIFVTKRKGKYEQVSDSAFNRWSKAIFEPIVGRRIHPHIFRESRATTLVVEQGKDINVVKKLLNHNSVQTSEIYVIRKDSDDADEAFA